MGISYLVICSYFRAFGLSFAKTVLLMKRIIVFSTIFLIAMVVMPELSAQCPMCKLSAESNLRDGGTAGKGLNIGILYMLVMPYILVGTLGYLWYKNRKNPDREIQN